MLSHGSRCGLRIAWIVDGGIDASSTWQRPVSRVVWELLYIAGKQSQSRPADGEITASESSPALPRIKEGMAVGDLPRPPAGDFGPCTLQQPSGWPVARSERGLRRSPAADAGSDTNLETRALGWEQPWN